MTTVFPTAHFSDSACFGIGERWGQHNVSKKAKKLGVFGLLYVHKHFVKIHQRSTVNGTQLLAILIIFQEARKGQEPWPKTPTFLAFLRSLKTA